MEIKQEIPVKSFAVAVYLIHRKKNTLSTLLLRRSGDYLYHNWQMVSGRVEKGEKAWEAALRELKEETGITPQSLYALDNLQIFYEWREDSVFLVPVFVALVDQELEPTLNPEEHDQWKWVDFKTARLTLEFKNQVDCLDAIEEWFLHREPSRFLKIEWDRPEGEN